MSLQKYIVKGQAKGATIQYVCVIDGKEYLTPSRPQAHVYDDIPAASATVSLLNLRKPFKRPDLTYSRESIYPESAASFACGHCIINDDLVYPDYDRPDDWTDRNPGLTAILALALAVALAWVYMEMMTYSNQVI